MNYKDLSPTIRQYFELYKEYTKKFGEKTAVLMRVGKFYECYQIFDYGNAELLSKSLNMNLVKKNGSKEESSTNPKMVGFPEYSLYTQCIKLIDQGWTIVKVDQFDAEFKNNKERKVTQIYSASTFIENETKYNNFLISINYEIVRDIRLIYFVALDLSTGTCKCIDMYDTQSDVDNSINTFIRHINAFDPSELIIKKPKNVKEEEMYKLIISYINIEKCVTHTIDINSEYMKPSYRAKFFENIFKTNDVGLNYYPGLEIGLLMSIQFAYDHDHTIIEKLNLPELITDDELLSLNNDAIFQLNLVSVNSKKCLFDVIDFTSTNMGKRLLKERLLRPTSNIEELSKRYKIIEEIMQNKNNKELTNILSNILDIEKKHRKCTIGKLLPREFAQLENSYKNIILLLSNETVKNVVSNYILKTQNIETIFSKFSSFYNKIVETFNIELMFTLKTFKLNCNIFNSGVYEDLDDLQEQIDKLKNKLEILKNSIIEEIGIVDCVKLECSEESDYYFATTVKRAEKLKSNKKYNIVNLKSVSKITTYESNEISLRLKELCEEIGKLSLDYYTEIVTNMMFKYKNLLKLIIKIVSIVDIGVSGSISARKYGYTCPKIKPSVENKSYIKCEHIRHPIIERDESNGLYVGNDVCIGNTESFNGMLLYGVNAAGKSSLLRSVGCNIILAQAGLFVSASNFVYYPFKTLICKISCVDNLFKRESTYIVELNELNNILKNQSCNSLVLADELCNGTESYSASSLVASTISELVNTKTPFIISSHLHEIVNDENIKNTKELIINNIDYLTHKLQKGSGPEFYGLEIASQRGLPKEFMKKAYEFRSRLENRTTEIVSTKKSKYNANVYVDKCERCGSTTDLCTHHIQEQHTADENGLIDGKFHKNAKYNLEILCRKCHQEHHQEHK